MTLEGDFVSALWGTQQKRAVGQKRLRPFGKTHPSPAGRGRAEPGATSSSPKVQVGVCNQVPSKVEKPESKWSLLAGASTENKLDQFCCSLPTAKPTIPRPHFHTAPSLWPLEPGAFGEGWQCGLLGRQRRRRMFTSDSTSDGVFPDCRECS